MFLQNRFCSVCDENLVDICGVDRQIIKGENVCFFTYGKG